MQKITLLATSILLSIYALAVDVKLKITYNGKGVSGHTVSVMIGGGVLGKGVTDSDGEVEINVSSLPTKSIDLKGEKSCSGAQKSWEVKGFVTLDGSNFAHLKMEEPIAEMVEASGGFMSEKMMVASYGLVCAGSSNSNKSSSSNESTSSKSEGTSSSNSSTETELPPMMTKEEALEARRSSLAAKVDNISAKIVKKNSKIESGKLDAEKEAKLKQDVAELTVEQKIAQNDLDKVNLTIQNGKLTKTERAEFKAKNTQLKDELKAVKATGKIESIEPTSEVSSEATSAEEKTESVVSESESPSEFEAMIVNEEDLPNLSTSALNRKKIKLKSNLGSRKMKLKTRKKFLSPNEIEQTEKEIEAIEKSIELIEQEVSKRETE